MTQLTATLRLFLALSASFLFAPDSASGQDATATQALPAAREVIERFAQVCNLHAALEKTQSMHLKGTFSVAGSLEGPAEIWSAKPARRRSSMDMGGFGTMLSGTDGEVAWMTHPMVGVRILKDTELLQSLLEAAYDASLKTDAAYESLRTVGRESFEGKECYKLELVAKPLPGMDAEKTREVRTTFEFYEVESGLLAGSTGRQESELGGGPFTQVVSDYKDFGGQRIATQTRVRHSGQEIALKIETVEFDAVADEVFALPPEVKKMLAAPPKSTAPAKPQ